MEFTQKQVQQTLADHHVVTADLEEVACACGRTFWDSKGHGRHFTAELILLWSRGM